AWTKLDPDTVIDVLQGGADDIGGLLIDGALMPEAGQEAGRVMTAQQVSDIAARVGRTPVQRTTGYGAPSAALLTPIPQVRGK
ncbi:MAG: FO synthase, partial [Gordonia amarae]